MAIITRRIVKMLGSINRKLASIPIAEEILSPFETHFKKAFHVFQGIKNEKDLKIMFGAALN